MRTLEDLGGIALNYAEVTSILERNGKVAGIKAVDVETGEAFEAQAQVVINATGVFADGILRMDPYGKALPLALSQGSHIVLSQQFLPGTSALMIPKTDDGRVLFAIPWHEHLLVGTTDEAVQRSEREPRATPGEKAFLMEHVARYLGRKVEPSDVLSVWAGLRPLVRKGNTATSKLSRDHTVVRSTSGLITVAGGKWTTYRKMGEDAVTFAMRATGLRGAPSRTRDLKLHGWTEQMMSGNDMVYGTDLPQLEKLCETDADLNSPIHPLLPYRKCEVVWAARHEHARTTEDVLARRMRALFLNASAAMDSAVEVSRILAKELGQNEQRRARDLERFLEVAKGYMFAT
jgi:glycerol-3-phosphate dehydrogenase